MKEKQRYSNIQLLRVIACLGVFAAHLAPRMGAVGRAAKAANFGASGVYLFFVISGFLAVGAKELQPESGGEQAKSGNRMRRVCHYYVRRFFRVLPLYYAVILYNIVLHEILLRDVPADPAGLGWLRYFLLTNAVVPGPDNFWSNLSATWTVSLFVFFYLCMPIFAKLVKNVREAVILYLSLLALRYVWVAAGLSSYMMAFYYLHFFALGILVRFLAELDPAVFRKAGIEAIHASAWEDGLKAGFMTALAAGLWLLFQVTGLENDYFISLSWVFAVCILLTMHFSWKRKDAEETAVQDRIRKAGMAERAVSVLDRYSYSIYLVHAVVIDGIGLLQAHVSLSGAAVFFLALGLTAAGAFAAYHLIEKPMEKVGRRLVAAGRI